MANFEIFALFIFNTTPSAPGWKPPEVMNTFGNFEVSLRGSSAAMGICSASCPAFTDAHGIASDPNEPQEIRLYFFPPASSCWTTAAAFVPSAP